MYVDCGRSQNRSRLDSSGSSSTVASLAQERGSDVDRRSRKPPSGAQRQRESFDRSYDAELDESTVSEGRDLDPRLKGARPKQSGSSQSDSSKLRIRGGKVKGDEGSLRSQSSRTDRGSRSKTLTLSNSTQEDETLEDVSDGGGYKVFFSIFFFSKENFKAEKCRFKPTLHNATLG
jgi:hypothetical protein